MGRNVCEYFIERVAICEENCTGSMRQLHAAP